MHDEGGESEPQDAAKPASAEHAVTVRAIVHPVWRPFPIRSGWLSYGDGVLRFTDDKRGVLFELPRAAIKIKRDWGMRTVPRFVLHGNGRRYIVAFGVDTVGPIDLALVLRALDMTL
jgi:hypothetical protein